MNYNQSINLLKLKNACIVTVKGKTTTKKGVFIPIEENDLYVALDESLKPKGVYLGLASWELKQKGQYGDTHLLKQSFSKDFRETMSEEELKNAPILGNMKPIERTNDASNVPVPEVSASEDDDLPF